MSVPNVLILTPIRFDVASLALVVTANSVQQTLTMSVTPGRDYWVSGDNQADGAGAVNGVGDLLQMFEDMLETHAQISAATVSMDSDYSLTIQVTATGTTDLEWSHASTTLDPEPFGFTDTDADDAGAGTISSPSACQGVWNPEQPVSVDSRNRQPIVGGVALSLSGYPRVSRIATPLPERELVFELVNQRKVLDEFVDSDEPYGSFEWNWTNALALGRNFRLYENESDLSTAANYGVYRVSSLDQPLERGQQYNVLWTLTLMAVLLEAA